MAKLDITMFRMKRIHYLGCSENTQKTEEQNSQVIKITNARILAQMTYRIPMILLLDKMFVEGEIKNGGAHLNDNRWMLKYH